jgi:tryptophan synthase alpha chain
MTRIERKFRELKKANKKAFIAFITAGYPDLATTGKLMLEFQRLGVDIVELGVPFSDPLADGPVIQEASQYALKRGVNLPRILALVKKMRPKLDLAVCLMTYYNPVFVFGQKKFVRQARMAGVDGLIVPDLPPEEAVELSRLCASSGIDLISFLAPTSSLKRVRKVASRARGFIYYVSLTGVTGERNSLSPDIAANIRRIKRYASVPVCAGFGISSRAQAAEVNRVADGVIVGSAIMRKLIGCKGRASAVGRASACVRRLKV